MTRSSRMMMFLAVTALLIAALSIWFEFTPVASIADTRLPAMIASLFSLAMFAGLRSTRRGKAGVAAASVVVMSVIVLYGLYDEEAVRFRNGDVELAGTLVLPRWRSGPHPAVVFIHGSGREVRNGFGWHAKLFARHGIAALIYDKRGAGESSGETWEGTYEDYAADAAAAIEYLRSRDDIDRDCVGVFGLSEGGWVASIVAGSLVPDVGFVIVASTTPMTPAEQVAYETGSSLAAAGFDDVIVSRAVELQRRVLQYQRTGVPDPRLASELRDAASQAWFEAAELPDKLYPIEEYRWWRGVMDFQSRPHWRRVRAPVLAISGGRDRNSDVLESHRRIAMALRDGGNRSFTGRVFPRMEHGLIEWWLPGRIPPPRFPRGFAGLLVDWTRAQTVCEPRDSRK